jgi:xanthine dehydrogenase accessory factor
MAELTLANALSLATAARDRGEGAVVVNVIADRSPLGLSRTARMAVFAASPVAGSIDSSLDAVVTEIALACLRERRSRVRSLSMAAGEPRLVGTEGGEVDLYFDVMSRPPTIVVVGGGHIAMPLATIAALLDFRVTVLDDRPEFVTAERFSTASDRVLGPYAETLATLPVDEDTYIVLVTRGHVHDLACLELVAGSRAAYIGMIGSKRRVRTVLRHAREHGADESALRRIHAPVGLDIGAQTPQEIAVSIMAEIVRVRRGGTGASLALRDHVHS